MYAIYYDLIDWSVFDLQEAEQQFLEALKLSPNSAEIHGNLGKGEIEKNGVVRYTVKKEKEGVSGKWKTISRKEMIS